MIGWMLWIHRLSFHSTDFPYERGPGRVRGTSCCTRIMVSIQLISPTRGDIKRFALPGYFKYQVSIQLISPTRGDVSNGSFTLEEINVSIQLISPTRGDREILYEARIGNKVSIQLISPTRGDRREPLMATVAEFLGFHSTDFPYERGPKGRSVGVSSGQGFVSFHSTDFPYERGHTS